MNINYEYYKMFYYVAKNKNVTKAADELNISQPAISRIIKSLEDQLNTKLFIRDRKGVILTKKGEELYLLIRDSIKNIINAEIDFSKIIKDNSLKVAVDKTVLNCLINNDKINKLLSQNRDISFINTKDFSLLNQQLLDKLVDFAIITEPLNYKFDDKIVYKNIDSLHLVFASNKKTNKENNALVIPNKNSKLGKEIYNFLKDNNYLNNTNKLIYVDDFDSIISIINNGYANGVFVKELIDNNSLFQLSELKGFQEINIGILYSLNNKLLIESLFN